jgi:hypothetical protein
MIKKMDTKNPWNFAAIFMITLILTLPIYSASSYASLNVQISKNEGEAGIWGFIDAESDTWKVEATITGAPNGTVNPENVVVKIGNNKEPFNSCTSTALGVACEYISPLTDGVKEAEHPFQVVYSYLDVASGDTKESSNGDVIAADGSAPKIFIGAGDVKQNKNGQVELNFIVTDKVNEGAPAVGLKLIEIIDADTNNVLETIQSIEGLEKFDYKADGVSGGILLAELEGEGLKRIKIKAEDLLGHKSSSSAVKFSADFIKPKIKTETLEFTDFGKFIGDFAYPSDISIDVEDTNLEAVIAISEDAELNGQQAQCDADPDFDNLWHCVWKNVEVLPKAQVSLTVIAVDDFGNIDEKTVSKSFTKDNSPPKVLYFGTERVFEDKSYVNSGENRILLEVKDDGSGVNNKTIRANLGGLGATTSEEPNECIGVGDVLSCYWDTYKEFNSDGIVRISLAMLEDNVGNEAQLPEIELNIDNSPPKIEKIEFYGKSETGEKNYFQSNDNIVVKFTASEENGLTIAVNLNDLVMDAETKFPEIGFTENFVPAEGWQIFTEADWCNFENNKWVCILETESLKSGPDNSLDLEIKIFDTAGNLAEEFVKEPKNMKAGKEGRYRFDLLGLDSETNPDYWEVSYVRPVGGTSAFIDLDTTPITYTRLPMQVTLKAAAGNIKAINIELMECVPSDVIASKISSSVPTGSAIAGLAAATPETTEPAATPELETAEAALEPAEGTGEVVSPDEANLPSSPEISRSLLYGGVSPFGESSPKPKLILEFTPFDGREMFNLEESEEESWDGMTVEFLCKLKIFSKVGTFALNSAEIQEVYVKVPFAFSFWGAQDENLEEKIENLKHDASTGIWGLIGTLAEILKWVRYVGQALGMINSVVVLFQAGKKVFGNSAAAADKAYPPVGRAVTATAMKYCFGTDSSQKGLDNGILKTLNKIVSILTCVTPSGWKWYDSWNIGIVKYYNALMSIESGVASSFAGVGGYGDSVDRAEGAKQNAMNQYKPARSVYDNLYLSIAALCVTGLINNLEKIRQIKCRKIMCYENEIASGLATVDTCDALEGLLLCKYYIGELWYILPFSQFYDKIIMALQKSISDPVALTRTVSILACGIHCMAGTGEMVTLSSTCQYIYFLWDAIDEVENWIGFITQMVDEFKDGGVSYCDSVL